MINSNENFYTNILYITLNYRYLSKYLLSVDIYEEMINISQDFAQKISQPVRDRAKEVDWGEYHREGSRDRRARMTRSGY